LLLCLFHNNFSEEGPIDPNSPTSSEKKGPIQILAINIFQKPAEKTSGSSSSTASPTTTTTSTTNIGNTTGGIGGFPQGGGVVAGGQVNSAELANIYSERYRRFIIIIIFLKKKHI
jgi:hypothetical protein